MISVVQLGLVDYATGLRLQQSLVELRKSGRIPDTLLLLEHTPVITLGRNARRENIVASADALARRGVEVFETDRGGDVTFHGPGQLVGYPIFDLRACQLNAGAPPETAGAPPQPPAGLGGKRKTLGAVDYVRRLEEVLIRACADFGIAAARIPGLTGAWTQPSPARPEQAKIAAIGVHISRGITSHGFALNVNTSLDYFGLIIPCGIAAKPVTSMEREKGAPLSLQDVAESVSRNFGRVFGRQILWVDTLDTLVGNAVGIPNRPPSELRAIHEDEVFLA